MCAVTLWPPLKDSQCLSPWLMFSVCSYGCSWAYASVFFFFFYSFSCLSLRFSAATESLIIFIHIGAFFAIGTGLRNINLVWSLLNLNYIFQNSSYQVISLGGVLWEGGAYIRRGRSMPGQDGNEYGCSLLPPIWCHLVPHDNSPCSQKKYNILPPWGGGHNSCSSVGLLPGTGGNLHRHEILAVIA